MARLVLPLVLLVVFLAPGSATVSAGAGSVIIVSTTTDAIAVDGKCSLREAVIAANTDQATNECLAGSGADLIRFDPALPSPLAISLTPGEWTENASLDGDFDVNGEMTIEGRPGSPVVIDAGAAPGTGIIQAMPGSRLTLSDFELRNTGAMTGGAVNIGSSSWVTLTRVSLVGGSDAGVHATGRLTMIDGRVADHGAGITLSGGRADLVRTDLLSNETWALRADNAALSIQGGRIAENGSGVSISAGQAQVNGVLIEANRAPGLINDGGRLVMVSSTVRNNSGTGFINAGASAVSTVMKSRITGNVAASDGGGIRNAGALVVEDSTIDGNTARAGGAIYHTGVSLKLTNVTISGNAVTDNGGGIYAQRETTLYYVTLAGNQAGGPDSGGNLYVDQAQIASAGSLFAHAPGVESCASIGGHITSLGGNIEDGASCAFATHVPDLLLGPLQGSAAGTPVHALLPGSPAIDTGASAYCPASDQLGVKRPQGGACDSGAYEAGYALWGVYLPVVLK